MPAELPIDALIQERPSDTSEEAAPREVRLPSDFDSEVDFIMYARELFQEDLDFDRDNREQGIEDAKFVSGDQWDPYIRNLRESANKPVLTINRLPAFVGQIVGNRRMNETQVAVLPDNGGTKEVAVTRRGLIRNIEKVSKADRAYDKALENCVIGGVGNFGVGLRYAACDVFEQDIYVSRMENPWAVVWDRMLSDPTGRDAGHCFVVFNMPLETFKKKYPNKSMSDLTLDTQIIDPDTQDGWFTPTDVRVVAFWRMRTRSRKIVMLTDGKVVYEDVNPVPEDRVAVNPTTGEPYRRTAECPYAEMYLMSGADLLAGPYELPISRLPVFRVPAWEINVGSTKNRFGLVRNMKDPQRLHNYWRSTIAEKLMLAPRARWMASDVAVAGRENSWRTAHLTDDPLLVWNGDSGEKPEYIQPVPLEISLVQEANMASQDLRDVSNLHEASLGQQSNEVSGKAIVARQRVGEIGTIIYLDNLNAAIAEAGEVMNELIPVAYDSARIVRTLGPDDAENFVKINDPTDPNSVDITAGKYSVTITSGPSYATKRIEAQEAMLAMFNAAPQIMATAADLYVENLDFPGADKLARRLRKTIPSEFVDPKDLEPDEEEARQAAAQGEQEQQQMAMVAQMAQLKAELEEKQAKARLAIAQASEAEARAQLAQADAFLRMKQANTEGAKFDLTTAQAEKTAREAMVVGTEDRGDSESAEDEAAHIGADLELAVMPKKDKTNA